MLPFESMQTEPEPAVFSAPCHGNRKWPEYHVYSTTWFILWVFQHGNTATFQVTELEAHLRPLGNSQSLLATQNNMAEVTPVHFSATNGINVELSRPTEINESSASKPNMPQFSEVSLNKDCVSAKIKSPRKILHFSDGVLEEYSSEDESEALVPDTSNLTVADPKTMSWFPYFFHLALRMGTKALAVCDYLGEHLAYFFGITSPKYQYELEEYQKMVQEEEEEKRREAEQMAGWRSAGDAEIGVTAQPGAAPLPNSTQRSADVPLQRPADVPLPPVPATPDQQSMQWQRY